MEFNAVDKGVGHNSGMGSEKWVSITVLRIENTPPFLRIYFSTRRLFLDKNNELLRYNSTPLFY